MKQFLLAVCAISFALLMSGCNKDTPLVEGGKTQTSLSSGPATDEDSGTEPASTGTTGGTGEGTQLGTPNTPLSTGMAPKDNPSIGANGEMIKQEGNNPAPEGRVWCDNCHGHLPKEDAVSVNGKTLCPACAEEAK